MKERNEKQPIDDLFARKLKDISLPVRSDGLARLQARMGQPKAETRVVFWRDPTVQRFMAIAACLVLICLFGWLYLSSETPVSTRGDAVATNKNAATPARDSMKNEAGDKPLIASTKPAPTPEASKQTNSKLAEKSDQSVIRIQEKLDQRVARRDLGMPEPGKGLSEPTILSSEKDLKPIAKADDKPVLPEATVEKVATIQKPAVAAERVLVVTIAEPEALVAARRTAKVPAADDSVDSMDGRPEKETKMATLWQQVKRIKQGEIFARKDAGEEERGLIGRAYSGLKQTLDKDKSIKQ